jgi:hypothetical protein
MKLTRAWVQSTLEQLVVVAGVAFAGALIAGGTTFNVSTLHSAELAAYGAGLSFLQSVVANLLHPQQSNVVTAVKLRSQSGA